MANLIVFGMAVVFALIGSKQRLLKAWMILINAVFSVYIALWGADFLAGSLSLFNEKSEAYKYLCLIGGSWVVLMFVFHAAEKQLMPNPEEYSFRGGRRRFCRNVCSDAGRFSDERPDSLSSATGDRGGGRQGD